MGWERLDRAPRFDTAAMVHRRLRRSRSGPDDPPAGYFVPATLATYLATAVICAFVSRPPNAGMPPPPLMTWRCTTASVGLSWSRFGPTVPCAFAAARGWQGGAGWGETLAPAGGAPRS